MIAVGAGNLTVVEVDGDVETVVELVAVELVFVPVLLEPAMRVVPAVPIPEAA